MFRPKTSIILIIVLSLLFLLLPAAAMADLEKVKQACVVVESYYLDAGEEYVSYGSGFIVDPNGWIVTNAHVIMSNDIDVRLTIGDREHTMDAEVFYLDDTIDIAVLKVGLGGLEYLELADDSELRLGQQLYAMGSPLVFTNILSDGIFSDYNEELGMIQHTAELYHGNSGGPLVTEDGDVVGVNSMYIEFPDEGTFYFAIPSHLVTAVLDSVYAETNRKTITVDVNERIALYYGYDYDDTYDYNEYDFPEFTGTAVSPSYISDLLYYYPDGFVTIKSNNGFTVTLPDFFYFDESSPEDYALYGTAGYFAYDDSNDPYWFAVPDFWVSYGYPEIESFKEFKNYMMDVYEELGYTYSPDFNFPNFDGFNVYYQLDLVGMVAGEGSELEGMEVLLIFIDNPDWDRYVSVEASYFSDITDEEFDEITFALVNSFLENLELN